MQKVTNRITINYNENEQEETEKVVEFSNRLTELFNRMFTENFKIEINVKQFDEMVELVIKKFLSYDEIQDILRDEKFPMIRYIDYIVSELPEDTNIIFDMDSYRVYKDDQEIILTGLELKLLFFLLENNGIIVTRDMIIDKIWDVSGKFVNDNTLSVYIKRIREKIGCEDIIKTIKGIGYRIDL